MSKGETFKNLDTPPTARDLLDMGQLTAELRHVNHETLHRLADVLNPLAKSMSSLVESTAIQIADLSSASSSFQKGMLISGDGVRVATAALRDELQEIIRQSQRTIEKLQDQREKTDLKRFTEIIVATVITSLISMFLYMRFLNF